VLVNRRQRRLVNIRFWADQAIEAMRVQVSRLEGGSKSHRVDLDFYLIAAWRLMEQIRQAWVGYQVPGADDLWHEFNTRFPYIDETRDWWIHATDRIVNHSYFANDVMRWTAKSTISYPIGEAGSSRDLARCPAGARRATATGC
jgi:hypothetical protein